MIKLFENEYKIFSIVGMAKNAGKTVTLNYLIELASENHIRLGLTSIGRDGERQDIVTRTEKPMIFITKGTLIATAEMLFNLSEVKLEIVEVTAYDTSMGKIIIGRALNDGYVQLGGPTTNQTVRKVSEKMITWGADRVLVDGALDRASSASPAITDACILSTGAVLSRDMNKAIEQTVHRANLFKLEGLKDEAVMDLWDETGEAKGVYILDGTLRVSPLNMLKTALLSGRTIGTHLTENSQYVFIKGALVAKTLKDILESSPYARQVTYVVGDATKIFIEQREWNYFMRVGVTIKVRYEINLMALTVNPYAPSGYFYDSDCFRGRLSEALKDLVIVDVMTL
ncbi:lysine 5,6-aminomutase reactivase subunit KamB [Fusibacter ferrireducens]|uniref:Uncharacterized protein n=1 Tax=Fusibacter ferrireducens TaxID=2785058 RepID=A0ABR9ZYF9_9FIRM|nr:hypothetical protein [Fusibacter ferrireducens]MBF4695501.1 hypothetical protein [Fusibacter ferrireducens]